MERKISEKRLQKNLKITVHDLKCYVKIYTIICIILRFVIILYTKHMNPIFIKCVTLM